jgi:uncharacterized protein YdaU (DUF1376 family)
MSRRTMPYHRRYHQDALQGYRRLDLEQRGAYSTILDLIYDEGGPIEFNERWLAGELNSTVGKARKLISQLIELRKIYITPAGKISNHRCETEIENSIKISKKCANSVKIREEKKRKKPEKTNAINGASYRPITERSSIPVPVPVPEYNNSSLEYDVARDPETGPPDMVAEILQPDAGQRVSEHALDAAPYASGGHLLQALEGRGRGRAELHDLLNSQRTRRH